MMVDPRFMSAHHWASQTTVLIAGYGTIPKLVDESQWRAWASFVAGLPAFADLGVPGPRAFDEWSIWARAFNQAVQPLGL